MLLLLLQSAGAGIAPPSWVNPALLLTMRPEERIEPAAPAAPFVPSIATHFLLLMRPELYVEAPVAPPPTVFTGSATLTTSKATASGSATFVAAGTTAPALNIPTHLLLTLLRVELDIRSTVPSTVFTGSAALTTGAATASGSATFVAPITAGPAPRVYPYQLLPVLLPRDFDFPAPTAPLIYIGTSAVTTSTTTASAVATFTAPVYTGTASVTIGATTASGTAIFATVVYSGNAAVTTGAATCSASATFTAPVYTGTAAVTSGTATASAAATFVAPVYTGTSAVAVGSTTAAGTAVFATVVYVGGLAVSQGQTTASGTATVTVPVYTGTSSSVSSPATVSASATFVAPVYTGSSTVTSGSATASGSAQVAAAIYTGNAAVTNGHATASGIATAAVPVYTGNGAVTVSHATAAGSGTAISVSVGVGAVTTKAATCRGTTEIPPLPPDDLPVGPPDMDDMILVLDIPDIIAELETDMAIEQSVDFEFWGRTDPKFTVTVKPGVVLDINLVFCEVQTLGGGILITITDKLVLTTTKAMFQFSTDNPALNGQNHLRIQARTGAAPPDRNVVGWSQLFLKY